MWYREITDPPSKWKRVRLGEWYKIQRSFHLNCIKYEFKYQEASPKQKDQRARYMKLGRLYRFKANLSDFIREYAGHMGWKEKEAFDELYHRWIPNMIEELRK